jgi:hypothetical protein
VSRARQRTAGWDSTRRCRRCCASQTGGPSVNVLKLAAGFRGRVGGGADGSVLRQGSLAAALPPWPAYVLIDRHPVLQNIGKSLDM